MSCGASSFTSPSVVLVTGLCVVTSFHYAAATKRSPMDEGDGHSSPLVPALVGC
jgi:hypothetical protein